MNGKWKLDRRQFELCAGNVERKAGRDLAAYQHLAGVLQGRRCLECHREHQRWIKSCGVCVVGAVFRDGRGQDLRQLYRDEEAGSGLQMLHPLCAGAGGGIVGHGADDRRVSRCPGHGDDHHGFLRTDSHVCHHITG